ncbi:carbohydrate phosphatase [Plenodomus tracheiphilus IPT5]|uniref:Carbohydrate phosphatase n=1 Tax=Plenodomus tracheiphilus IPT5 TaxID=1408161 RepID=A0A6A7B1H9_9PLEO|nr:carbohydrate phosphatase [Plenodomus tracheiphilus IPT5]
MSSHPYTRELDLALRVVHTASLLTKRVLRSLSNNVTAETKADDSPVTIADFAAQAMLISALHAEFPQDAFLGEESADALRENEELGERVWQLVQQAKEAFAGLSSEKGEKNDPPTLTFPTSKEQMFDLIDLGGNHTTTSSGRVWVMDPIDGTATFMQNQQYAVCLCLLTSGTQTVSVIGCPNLSLPSPFTPGTTKIYEDTIDTHGNGIILSAIKGQGTYLRTMTPTSPGTDPTPIDLTRLPPKPLQDLTFIETKLGATSLAQDAHKAVAHSLGANWPGTTIWSQQIKYVALTLGAADVMLRIPRTVDRYTCVWDHAGGHLCFVEAGGMVSDFHGEQIDFGQGRKIRGERNFGMLATMPGVFGEVGKAVKDVLATMQMESTGQS